MNNIADAIQSITGEIQRVAGILRSERSCVLYGADQSDKKIEVCNEALSLMRCVREQLENMDLP